ncbi:MAG: glycosyltransferase WbuB [Hydrogenimonas sp.]|nr:MAG: glycosyltransferase WbuB [Hydrogenimonas sp.]
MKILFITDNFPPEVNAPATRTYEHCCEWVQQGADVTVITCAPNFPHGNIYEGYSNRLYQKEEIEGIKVIRVWSYMASNSGFIKRVLDYMSFALSAFGAGLFQQFDIIIATSPQFFTTWAGWGLSKVKRKPWIFELRDLWPESIRTVGALQNEKILNILEKIELALYKDANCVVAVTDAFKRNLIERGIDPNTIEVVTNGANMELFYPRPKDDTLLQSLGLKDKFIIGYIGTHGMAHSLDFIVQSIAKIEDPELHFLLIGDGAMKSHVIALASQLKLTNITFLAPITKEDVPRYLSIIDLSLAPLKKSDTFKSVIPSKIFEASAMRKPTLLGVEGQAQEIIETYGAGICFKPEDEEDFIQKVLHLKDDKELYKTCQEGCEALAMAFDRKKLANRLLHILEDIS